jgi:hypothetical protein
MAVVDLLEPIDIDVREHQMPVSVPRAIDLTLEQQQPDLTAKRPGELIELRASQIISAQAVIAVRVGAIFDRRFAIRGRGRSIPGALGAVSGSLSCGRLVEVVIRHGLVSVTRGVVSVRGRLISIRRALLGRRLRLITIGGIVMAVIRGVLAVTSGVRTVRGSLVGFGR